MSRLSENLVAGHSAHLNQGSAEFALTQRKILLGVAHAAIISTLAGEPIADPPTFLSSSAAQSSSPDEWRLLLEPRGVFTTLYLRGALRGCVGYATAHGALCRAVAETARAAAFEDSRFWPVTADEAPELKISLSVLSPLFLIAPENVEVGRHGLVISDGLRRGLLLPQVPVEHGWDRETFLEQTCQKAGLRPDTWRKSATIQAFTAEVFGDEDVSA